MIITKNSKYKNEQSKTIISYYERQILEDIEYNNPKNISLSNKNESNISPFKTSFIFENDEIAKLLYIDIFCDMKDSTIDKIINDCYISICSNYVSYIDLFLKEIIFFSHILGYDIVYNDNHIRISMIFNLFIKKSSNISIFVTNNSTYNLCNINISLFKMNNYNTNIIKKNYVNTINHDLNIFSKSKRLAKLFINSSQKTKFIIFYKLYSDDYDIQNEPQYMILKDLNNKEYIYDIFIYDYDYNYNYFIYYIVSFINDIYDDVSLKNYICEKYNCDNNFDDNKNNETNYQNNYYSDDSFNDTDTDTDTDDGNYSDTNDGNDGVVLINYDIFIHTTKSTIIYQYSDDFDSFYDMESKKTVFCGYSL